MDVQKKPRHLIQVAGFWRRPTLARPVAVLPSGLQRFTSVFGMGTGGAAALLSPEVRVGLALEPHRRFRCFGSDASADANLWRLASDTDALQFNFQRTTNHRQFAISWFADSLAPTYRSSFRLRTADATTELRFVLRSFISHYCPESFRGSLLEK